MPLARAISIARIVGLTALLSYACGGGGGGVTSPSSPSPPAPAPPTGGACSALGQSSLGIAIGIVNGTECPTATASVALINMRDRDGLPSGSCSGTVIAPRAVLTAAHCLLGETATVRIYLGSGPEIVAQSFTANPNYRPSDASFDVGVILFGTDIGRTPVPLLLSRDARVGEPAVIAGWGRDQNQVAATLRAGLTTVTSVGPTVLETQFGANIASVCAGDSGGPLFLSEGGAWTVAGVTSANSTQFCSFGSNFYGNLRNPGMTSFILGLVPDAARR